MRNHLFLLLLVVALISFAGEAKSAEVEKSVIEKEIRELNRLWLAAENARDYETASSFYADDAVEMPSNTPVIVGREAIREWFKGWLQDPGFVRMSFSPESFEISDSGDLALERGTYRFVHAGEQGETEDVGKYITLWKKIDGRWKVRIDMANSDRPCN